MIKWLVGLIAEFTPETFSVLSALFAAYSSLAVPSDDPLALIAEIYALFPSALVAAEVAPAFDAVFASFRSWHPPHLLASRFVPFWELSEKCGRAPLPRFVAHPAFPAILRALLESATETESALAETIITVFTPMISVEGPIRTAVTAVFAIGDVCDLFQAATERAVRLFLCVVEAVPRSAAHALIVAIFAIAQRLAPFQLFPAQAAQLKAAILCGEAAADALAALGRLADVDFGAAPQIRFAELAAGFGFVHTLPIGVFYRRWVVFWARRSSTFEAGLTAALGAALANHARHSRFILAEWIFLELLSNETRPIRLAHIYAAANAASPSLVRAFFRFVADAIEDPRVFEAVAGLTPEIFDGDAPATRSADKVFAAALRAIDADIVLALYAAVCDLIDLATGDGRAMVMRAALVVEARPDLREVLVELFPVQDRQALIEADFPYVADLLFGADGQEAHGRFYAARTSDEDEEVDPM